MIQDLTLSSQELMELEDKYGAHNYHPLPVVLQPVNVDSSQQDLQQIAQKELEHLNRKYRL